MKISMVNNSTNVGDFIWPGGIAVMVAEATWGGGSIKIQNKTSNGTYVDVPSSTLSANGMSAGLYLPPGTYKSVVATATAVYADLIRVDT